MQIENSPSYLRSFFMKVLLANKFYYRRGGDCVCTLNLEQLLKDHNHDTAVFANIRKISRLRGANIFRAKYASRRVPTYLKPLDGHSVRKR